LAAFYDNPRRRLAAFARLRELGIPRSAAYPSLQKYQICLAIANKPKLAAGRNPYQDAASVVALRNELLHFESAIQPLDGVPEFERLAPLHKFVGKLKGKFSLNPLTAAHAPVWPWKLLALEKDAPTTRRVQTPTEGPVVAFPEVGGLHHRYERRAA
jgi:hypothetical protein